MSAIILFALFLCVSADTDFLQCLINFNNGTYGLQGGVDSEGNPTNYSNAVGITYEICTKFCGLNQLPFSWQRFSQPFSSWLLPLLALVSQLPFGAGDRLDNLISVVLTVGSPTLASYSLAITAINSRWIHRKFCNLRFPNRQNAARALDTLQQIPLQIIVHDGLLASLIVLPENDKWWNDVVERLNYNYKWSIATRFSIALVAIALVSDSFMGLRLNNVTLLWLWLLPVVIGWLLVPICGRQKLVSAMSKANDIAYVAHAVGGNPPAYGAIPADEPLLARCISDDMAINILESRGPVFRDEHKISPIFNYARFWRWVDIVEEIIAAFEQAAQRAGNHVAVRPNAPWVEAGSHVEINPNNRAGSLAQVQAYCGYSLVNIECYRPMWRKGVLSRVFVASSFALVLQWGTIASAALVTDYIPTVGLGCQSGSYILYGILSTLVWMMLMVSSILSHYCSIRTPNIPRSRHQTRINSVSVAAGFSVFLRRLSVLIAFINSVWVIVTCMFQFSNYFNNCYCNSSVLGLGSRAYYAIESVDTNIVKLRDIYIGSIVMGGGCVVGYALFVGLMVDRSG